AQSAMKTGNTLGKDAFLHLLVTELRYQDPLDPLKDRDFIAQMAQFSTLEQMQNLNRVGELQQATTMLGRPVIAEVHSNGTTEMVYGRVTGIRTFNGRNLLMLDSGREIDAQTVVSVMDEQGLEQYLQSLEGARAYIRVYNELGEVIDLRDILVTGYQIQNGKPYLLFMDGTEEKAIPLTEVWGFAWEG
ncbi:MAG: hypothetical protein GX050_11060, partial [Firmicutes bacterium]|nr:hypothetical protein [Bacillota bacterium]